MLKKWLTILLGCTALAMAGTTGKIAGSVTDAESASLLPGVIIMVEGTSLGAITNLDGQYAILNVVPGTYTLRFNMLGYQSYRVLQVRVEIDITTTVSAKLRQQALVGEDVVVTADRPVVVRDISNSQMNIMAKAIETMPVQTVREVITLQAGIEQGRDGIVVRGGSANQTAFMLDGLIMNDERSNIPYTAISVSSVKEIQIQTGGFNAEYGNLRSGLVNVVTQEGDSRRYHATATVRYRPAAAKHFGPSIYDSHSYFNRPYMDPAVCYTGTRNGAWDDFTRRQYPNFEGWNAVSYKTLTDANAWNDLTPDGAKRLYEWQLRRQGDITKPDYVLDTGLGGPIPLLGARLGHARFFLTHFREQDMFIFPLSRDAYTDNHTQLKITSDLTSSIKLTLTGLYGEVRSVSPYDWTTTPTGYVLRDQEEIADLVNSSSGKSILYMPGYYSPSDIFRSMVGVQWTHMLSSKTFYEISAQFQSNKYNTFQTAMRDTTRSFQPVPGYYTDESPNGYWGYSVSAIDGTSMGGWMNLGRDASLNTTSNFRFDMTSQLNARSQLKAGWQLTYNDFDIKSSTYSPSMNTWTRSMFYNVFPFRIGAYLQDKLEFEGFIANLGVRLDYSNPNTTEYSVSTFDKNLSAGYGKTLEESVDQNDVQPELYWSPRLGVSHPITENSKLYFNYGHFRSEPFSSYRFRLQRESNGLVTYLGNPNLRMEKTVAYELGWSQSLFSQYLLNIAAYYKDVSNQPGWIYYANINSSVQYYKASNNNYADIRGVECTLTKTMGRWLSGFMNYTYHVSTSGYFDLLNYFQDPNRQRDYLRQNPTQSRPRPQPFARTNIDVHTPSQWGPSWLGMHPLADWNLNILAYWRKGRYETYNPNKIAGITDDVQWRDWHNLDLRISKTWRRGAGQLQLYLDINNILNTRYMSMAGFSDTYDYLYYLESLNFSWESGEQRGQDRVGDFRPAGVAYDPLEPNPTNDQAITARNNKRKETRSYIDMPNLEAFSFLNPRDVTFGVRINF